MRKMDRLWEVDSARGIAIIMMVISNFLFDLFLFKNIQVFYSGPWLLFARITVTLFILIAGVALTLSYARVRDKPESEKIKKFSRRGLKIFGIGILITLATWAVVGNQLVLFGALHLIGLSIILSYPLRKFRVVNLVLGLIIISIGFLIENISINQPWLLWLGVRYQGYTGVDYVPLMPWLGVFLIGIFLGNTLFPNGKGLFKKTDFILVRILSKLGRNSLIIYLVHQPVFVAIILFLL